jgi:hypothetical protein
LLFALQDSIELQVHSLDKEPIRDIAKLLATAYRRYLNRPAGSVAGLESPANGVAFYGGSSAHEDGTQDAD